MPNYITRRYTYGPSTPKDPNASESKYERRPETNQKPSRRSVPAAEPRPVTPTQTYCANYSRTSKQQFFKDKGWLIRASNGHHKLQTGQTYCTSCVQTSSGMVKQWNSIRDSVDWAYGSGHSEPEVKSMLEKKSREIYNAWQKGKSEGDGRFGMDELRLTIGDSTEERVKLSFEHFDRIDSIPAPDIISGVSVA